MVLCPLCKICSQMWSYLLKTIGKWQQFILISHQMGPNCSRLVQIGQNQFTMLQRGGGGGGVEIKKIKIIFIFFFFAQKPLGSWRQRRRPQRRQQYWCYYPHRMRDLVSPVCRIKKKNLSRQIIKVELHTLKEVAPLIPDPS